MSEQSQQTMEGVRVDNNHYVNEATLELLTRRIEADVKSNFMRWVGLPVGGAGIVAILVAFFFILPDKLDLYIESEAGQNLLQETVQSYIEDEEKGQKVITEKSKELVALEVESYFQKKSGHQYVDGLVSGYLKSERARDLIFSAVNEALKPVSEEMSSRISENSENLVFNVHNFSRITSFEKRAISDLKNILEEAETLDLKEKNVPIALVMPLGQHKRYDNIAIRDYIRGLRRYFKENFKYLVVLGNEGTFIAKLTPEQVRGRTNKLADILNSAGDDDKRVATKLESIFGKHSCTSIHCAWCVKDALKKNIWGPYKQANIEIAVIDEKGEFIGTTSREKLINGIL